jgi:hypothetical protein
MQIIYDMTGWLAGLVLCCRSVSKTILLAVQLGGGLCV